MKRNLCLLLFLSLFGSVFGQKHWVGFDAGYNITILAGGSNDTGGSRPGHGFSLTGSYQYEIRPFFYVETGLSFDNLSFQAVSGSIFNDADSRIGTETVVYTLNYLSIPIKLGFKSKKRTYVFFSVGVYPSFLLNANAAGSFSYENSQYSWKIFGRTNISKGASKFTIPFSAELGVGGMISRKIRMFGGVSTSYQLISQKLPRQVQGEYVSLGEHFWECWWFSFKIGIIYQLNGPVVRR